MVRKKERTKRRAKRESEIAEATAAFGDVERGLLAKMTREERGDYSNLNHLAFQFLAGHPLTEYAESLRNWAFANALNGGFRDHHDEFHHLVRLNLVDWKATRLAILEACKIFRMQGLSRTGRWALAYLLHATGESSEAVEANQLVEDLTKNREKRDGWRLIETFCATDLCNPSYPRPANIDVTVEKYAAP
ncbi:hypothetical protein [Bradyrhizobium sp. F1.13.3]|uniref:hypothetical protein n=1 Tax=Bradyrhizobium sp. F1.13.3 TaxID=3156351 RepID=UPI0033937094